MALNLQRAYNRIIWTELTDLMDKGGEAVTGRMVVMGNKQWKGGKNMFKALTRAFVRMCQRYLPDAYLFAIILSLLAFALAMGLTDKSFFQIVKSWGDGISGIFAFAMQMILILVTGHALASSNAIKGGLNAIARIPKTPAQGPMLVVLVAGIASFINWGFGLVVGALLAVAVARRLKGVDYAFLVAAGYAGFVVWHGGISGSIPLAVATPGHLVEKEIGGLIPVTQTIFAPYNLIIMFTIILTLPILFKLMAPRPEDVREIDPALLAEFDQQEKQENVVKERTPATILENSILINALFATLGLLYLGHYFYKSGFNLTLNIVIIIFLILGIILHKTPINYVRAMNNAIKGAGGIALQFPLYGGIQGIMVGTGLAVIIANWFVSFSTPVTFPVFTFLAGGLINLFVPSGGGQWIVQGPINIPAGLALGVDPAKVAMSIAYGDQWTNMIQPFWALPLLGIAKLGIRDIMGYCAMVLLWSGLIMIVGLLVL